MNTLTPEAIEMLADDYERGMIGPRRLRQYFDYLIQQLAAANARIAELEYKLMAQTETALQEIARREQAEAQCNEMEADCADFQAIIKRLQEENAKRFNDNTAMHGRMLGAEAQNKRMREALRRCGLCKDYSHEKAKCYHDYEGYRPPQATCDHPDTGFRLVDWAALEEKP